MVNALDARVKLFVGLVVCAAALPMGGCGGSKTSGPVIGTAPYEYYTDFAKPNSTLTDTYATGIAVDATSDTYVADYTKSDIDYYAGPSYTYTKTFGSAGSGPVQFEGPGSLALDSGDNLYVSDTGNHRIQVISSTGTLLRQITLPPTTAPLIPMALDSSMNVVVLDNGIVSIYNPAGSVISTFPVANSLNLGVAVDSSDNVYVTTGTVSPGGSVVTKYSSKGTDLGSFPSAGTTCQLSGLTVDSHGNVLAPDRGALTVDVWTTGGALVGTFGSSSAANGSFEQPDTVVQGLDGKIYIGDEVSHFISVFTYV